MIYHYKWNKIFFLPRAAESGDHQAKTTFYNALFSKELEKIPGGFKMGCLTRLLQRWPWARAFIFLSGYHYSFEDKIKLGLAVTLSPILPPVCPFSHVNLNGSRSNHVWRMPPHHIFLLRIVRIRAGFLYRKFAIPPLFRFLRYCSVVLSIWLLPISAIAQVPISGRQYIHLVGRLRSHD